MNAPGTGRKWPVRDHANFKIWTKRRATVLYISITLSYAVDLEENMIFMLEGCMGQRYSTKHAARAKYLNQQGGILWVANVLSMQRDSSQQNCIWKINFSPLCPGKVYTAMSIRSPVAAGCVWGNAVILGWIWKRDDNRHWAVQGTIRGNINAFSSSYYDQPVHRFWRRN